MSDLTIRRDLGVARRLSAGVPIINPGGGLPPVANVLGAVLVEDPAGTPIFRRLKAADVAPDFAILSFAPLTSVLEIGATAVAPSFAASYASPPITVLLDDDEGSPQKDVSGTPALFSSDGSFAKTANNDSVQFALTADDGGSPKVAFSVINWRPRTYFGADVDGLSTEADIEGLSGSQLDNNRQTTLNLTAGFGEHIYYAFPSSYGTPTFFIGGFEVSFVLEAAAVSVTNGDGVTQNYDLWKSAQDNLGATTVTVT